MAERPGRGSDQFALRMPDGMRDAIKKIADENGRSMNAEILHALSIYIDPPDDHVPSVPPDLDPAIAAMLTDVVNASIEARLGRMEALMERIADQGVPGDAE